MRALLGGMSAADCAAYHEATDADLRHGDTTACEVGTA